MGEYGLDDLIAEILDGELPQISEAGQKFMAESRVTVAEVAAEMAMGRGRPGYISDENLATQA